MRWGGFMWAGEGPGRPGMWLKADRVGMGPSACTNLGKVGHISILVYKDPFLRFFFRL